MLTFIWISGGYLVAACLLYLLILFERENKSKLDFMREEFDRSLELTREADLLRAQQAEDRATLAEKKLKSQEARHAAELEERTARIDGIIQKMSSLGIDRVDDSDGRYAITFTLSPKLIGYGAWDRESINLIAERVGRQVEHEIAKTKFVSPPRFSIHETRG